jgi:hypothetical protein
MAENHHLERKEPAPAASERGDLAVWAALPLLLLLIFGFYWKIWSGQYTWMTGDDFTRQVLPWLQFQAGEWRAGRFPAWDPNLWLGQPLVGQAQPGALYPLNWLLFLSPLRQGWLKEFWLNGYHIAIHLMAGTFAYLLARSLRRSRVASLLCGLVYALSGWMGTTDWPQMRNGAVWAPLVLLFLLRICRGERVVHNAIFGGFFLGISWLSGHHQQPIFLCLMSGFLLIYALFSRNSPALPMLAGILGFFAVAGATGAAQILPAREYGQLALRWVGAPEPAGWDTKVPFEVHKQYSMYPDSLLGILFPHMHVHSDPFVGVTALVLALLGLMAMWRWLEVRLLTAVGLGALVYALGNMATFEGWIYALAPIVDKARSPSMAVSLFGLAAAALAACGVDVLREKAGSEWLKPLWRSALGLGVFLFGARVFSAMTQAQVPPGRQEALFTGFAALLLAALLVGRQRGAVGPLAAAVCVSALFLAEVGNDNGSYLPPVIDQERMKPLRQMSELGDIAEYLRRQPGPFRVAVDDQAAPVNFGDWYGIHQTGGYLASITANLDQQETHAPHMQRLLGVQYAVRKEPTAFHSRDVFTGRSGLKVFAAAEPVLPRSFVVHEAEELKVRRQGPARAFALREELHRKTYVPEKPPVLASCGAEDRATVTGYEPGRVRIAATLGCRGMVVLTDTFYPGWEATVDGKPAKVWEAYAMVRGVVVEAGAHRVEFVYRPWTLYAGSALSLAAGCGVGALVLVERWRRRRKR